jgi:ERF superfamily protein
MKQAAAEQPAPSPPPAQAPPPPQEQLPQAAPQAITRQIDIQALLERAITDNSAVEVVEKLLQMTKDVRAIQAREAWYRAMADFQRQCPPIRKTKTAKIQSDRGQFAYAYAPLDEILETTRPIMGPLGLSVSWTTRFENKTVIANCRVSHEAGHVEESGEVPIPIDEASKMGATVAQRIGIATTYGKRYSLLSIIGIAPEDDDDASHSDQPRSTVQQPRRTSETSEQATDRILIVGAIADVEAKTSSAKKPYWRIKFDLAEGEESIFVNCWSESMSQSAIRMKAEGVLVHLWYKQNGEFKNLFDLSAAPIED